jgi:hypothetical protein
MLYKVFSVFLHWNILSIIKNKFDKKNKKTLLQKQKMKKCKSNKSISTFSKRFLNTTIRQYIFKYICRRLISFSDLFNPLHINKNYLTRKIITHKFLPKYFLLASTHKQTRKNSTKQIRLKKV